MFTKEDCFTGLSSLFVSFFASPKPVFLNLGNLSDSFFRASTEGFFNPGSFGIGFSFKEGNALEELLSFSFFLNHSENLSLFVVNLPDYFTSLMLSVISCIKSPAVFVFSTSLSFDQFLGKMFQLTSSSGKDFPFSLLVYIFAFSGAGFR